MSSPVGGNFPLFLAKWEKNVFLYMIRLTFYYSMSNSMPERLDKNPTVYEIVSVCEITLLRLSIK